ncbi:MAG TPA: metallophosphoesterase family protein [Candidatus Acidoferrales bacterium]|nr:metallophosphoesterase family protein [Candidatus Acidoferrales bacterium]
MRKREHRIGVISDTHGLLRPEAVKALRGSELILHAGDIGAERIIPELRKIAPVVAIRGNIDQGKVAKEFPATDVAEFAGLTFYLLHNRRMLDLKPDVSGFAAVIYGHSHKPEFYFENNVLYFNPGSAGPRRFNLPISLGRITVRDGELHPEIVELL